jgi:hypothetical protein
MRRIIGGLVGLGLIAGAGSVAYNKHGATVQIKGPNGQTQTVHLAFGKKHFQCPSGEDSKLNPVLIRQGRIKLTVNSLETQLERIDHKYPGKHAPHSVVMRYTADVSRGKRLLKAYRASVHEYNAMLTRDCTPG